MTYSPILNRHPLDHPGVVKFALGDRLTTALADSGEFHLLITAPSDSTTPEHLQGRRIMYAMSITKELADDLHRIASGTHRAVKIPPSKPTPSAALTPREIRQA